MAFFVGKAWILPSVIYLVVCATRAGADLPLLPFGYVRYLGCWRDTAKPDDDFRVTVMEDHFMTPQRCLIYCWEIRFLYALLKFGRQCQCIMSLKKMQPSYTPECRMPCLGNPAYPCGSADHVTAFETGAILEPDYYNMWEFIPKAYVGCYLDKQGDLCRGFEVSSIRMSVGFCLSACEQQLAAYASLKSARRCCCADTIEPSATKSDDIFCREMCGIRHKFACGGREDVDTAVYRTGVTVKRPAVRFKEPLWMNSHIPDNLLGYVKAFPKTKLAVEELDQPAKSLLEELGERQVETGRHIRIGLWVLAGVLALAVILATAYGVWRIRSRMNTQE